MLENDENITQISSNAMPGKAITIGDLIANRYEIVSQMVYGSTGSVLKCFDKNVGIDVVLKVLPTELSLNMLKMGNIKKNFKLLHELHHPNIASYSNLIKDSSSGNFYVVMAYCPGENLQSWVKHQQAAGTFSLETFLPIVQQIADALDYAHSIGIVHRNLKPENIIINHLSKVKLLNFSLTSQHTVAATDILQSISDSENGEIRNNDQYIAADQYALAEMSYNILTGASETNEENFINEASYLLPTFVQNTFFRALNPDLEQKFASCTEFTSALRMASQPPTTNRRKIFLFRWAIVLVLLLTLIVPIYFFCNNLRKNANATAEAQKIAIENRQIELAQQAELERQRQAELARQAELKRQRQAELNCFRFREEKNTISITGVKDRSIQTCNIPNSVTSIGGGAFEGCKNLTTITIPNSVTSIWQMAFAGCESLTSINIPDSVTSIGVGVFEGCKNLTTINIPDSVTKIGNSAFRDCKNLTTINIPDSIESMPYSVFDNIKEVIAAQKNPNFYFDDRGILFNKKTKALLGAPRDLDGNYVIPHSVTKIGNSAFRDCKNLTTIDIPNSVTSIGVGVFEGCKNLTTINIPDSVTSIGVWPFRGCESLTSINIPNSVTSIGGWAFGGCKNLTSINIPDSVTSIGVYAFVGCKNLTSINIPDSVTSIGVGTFIGCESLTSINIPNSVTSIGSGTFRGCKNLTRVTIPAHFSDQEVRKNWSIPGRCKIIRR